MQRLKLAHFLSPGDACHVARTTFLPGPTMGNLHDHDFHELFWVDAGLIRQRTPNGEESLAAGTLVLVRPHDAHAVNAADEPGTIVNIAFPSRAWRTLVARYGSTDVLFGRSTRHFDLTALRMHQIRSAAATLLDGGRSQLLIDCFLLQLMAMLKEGEELADKVGPPWLTLAVARLSDRTFAVEGVSAVVDAAGRSPEHVARMCRAVYGKSPTCLVTEARLAHAANDLSGSDASIVQIALDCGFETLSHFYASFAVRYGAPPAAWRRRQRQILRPTK